MSSARNDADHDRLVDYVRQALARIDAGQPVEPTNLCREHPHLAHALAEVLGLADELPLLQHAALREDPLAGVLLANRYRLTTCLGRGAMGVVYRGEDQELKRAVAVKILDARLFRDPEAERRFQREAEALAALQHGNVVAVFDRGRTPEGIHYLVMELLEGATVATVLDHIASGSEAGTVCLALLGTSPAEGHWPRQCASWARDLAHGLAAAHARHLVHRDVKPSNVFLARPGRPVLLDFGIAARGTDQRLTATQTTLGTPWYMAPEQVRAGGQGAAEPALDVYGLGATLYHMLALRPPYEGDAASVLAALVTADPAPLASVRSGLPRDLVAIVERCMERQPSHRYASAEALAGDLDAFLRHQPVTARPIGALGRRVRAWRRAPARPIAVVAVGIAVVVAAIAVPYVLTRRDEARARAKAGIEATLPSLLAIEGYPDQRVLAELSAEHGASVELLDRLLALDPDDTAARLMRAYLLLDLGKAAPAADDMNALAGRSPYQLELARRYAAAAPDAKGVRAVSLAGLPEPVTPKECFVAGFEELRHNDATGFAARADALFVRAGRDYQPARMQRLFSLAELAANARGAEQDRLVKTLYDETVALEELHGGPTARTCAMRGVALLIQKRYRECIPDFELSLQLRPDRHGPHQNLGVAHLRLNELPASERHLRAALALRPFAWNTRFMLAQLLRARGDFAAAGALAVELPKTGIRGEAWKVPDLIGSIHFAEAMALLEQARAAELAGHGDEYSASTAAMKEAAGRAVTAYDEALTVRASAEAQLRREFAAAIRGGTMEVAVVPFLRTLMTEPANAHQLANLAFLLPRAGLDAEQTAWIAALLRKLAQQLAEGDAVFAARMEQEIATGTQQWR